MVKDKYKHHLAGQVLTYTLMKLTFINGSVEDLNKLIEIEGMSKEFMSKVNWCYGHHGLTGGDVVFQDTDGLDNYISVLKRLLELGYRPSRQFNPFATKLCTERICTLLNQYNISFSVWWLINSIDDYQDCRDE